MYVTLIPTYNYGIQLYQQILPPLIMLPILQSANNQYFY